MPTNARKPASKEAPLKTRTAIGWNVVVALALLLGASVVQAQTVVLEGTQAIGIDGLDVDGTIYDVDFSTKTNPNSVYGDFPGELDFIGLSLANVARDAVDTALDGSAATTVAASGETGETVYVVGYGTQVFGRSDNLLHTISEFDQGWGRGVPLEEDSMLWTQLPPATKVFALFTATGGSPAPTIDFSADPATILSGQSSTLSWDVTNATTCTGSQGSSGWPGDKDPVSDSEVVSPTATSTYRLTCDGPGGQAESDVSVAVFDPMLGTTEARQTAKVNSIAGLEFGVTGNYDKPGFPLLLPQTDLTGNMLFHAGGSFSFSSPQATTPYNYSNWIFELSTTCGADVDACLVQTDEGTPWALSNVELGDGTFRMVFTDEGADAFNDLAVVPSIVQVFVTSERFTGDLRLAGETNGLDGGDNICTKAANDAGLAGAWTAWLSDGTVDAGDRMFDAEFQRLDGVVIANSLADLTDDSLDAPIIVTENGDELIPDGSLEEVWTGTNGDGTFVDIGGSCQSWTSSSGGGESAARIGLATEVNLAWTTVGESNPCNRSNRLYCFSASKFLPEETFANVTFIPIPEPSMGLLSGSALLCLAGIRRSRSA